MQLKLEKHHFYKLDGIASIKNHLEKLVEVAVAESKATGHVEFNVSYYDQEGLECFKSFSVPFELDLAELKILEVLLGRTDTFLVEGQGLDIQYELVINYEAAEVKNIDVINDEEVKEIELIPQDSIEIKDDQDLEEIKENISEYYEDKLADNLHREDQVLITKGHPDSIDFLNFLEGQKEYYKLKCLYVENEESLKQIAKDYQVSLDKLLAGYDRAEHKVLFTL